MGNEILAFLPVTAVFVFNGLVFWWSTASVSKQRIIEQAKSDARVLDNMFCSEKKLDKYRAVLKQKLSEPSCSIKNRLFYQKCLGELDEADRKKEQLTKRVFTEKTGQLGNKSETARESPNDPRFDPKLLAGPTKISGAIFAVESLSTGGARTILFENGVWKPHSGADAAEIMGGVPYTLTDLDRSHTILVAAMEQLSPAEQNWLMTQLETEARDAKIARDPVLSVMPRAAAIADIELSALMLKQLDASEARLGAGLKEVLKIKQSAEVLHGKEKG